MNRLMVGVRYSDYSLPYENANQFIEIGDYVVKNKGETSLHIFRNKILIKSLIIEQTYLIILQLKIPLKSS